ncbi:MAG: tetratricopeptide repeat protein [Burkholderiaceae bacterium]|nr:tetratricopeptide repeat protein [Burkholderiaceae bacterium]
MLARGFKAHQAGQLDEARGCYEQVLRHDPGHAEANQLMGLVARRLGDDAAAETCFRRSLAVQPAQPHVWNNLGNLLLAGARALEAEEALRQAVALQPAYADAHFNLSRALQRTARPRDAAASLARAWQLTTTPTPSMWQLKALIEADSGELGAAESTLRSALSQYPGAAALWHNLAVTLQRGHRYAEALRAHEQASVIGLDAADAHYNRGNTLQSLGRIDDALAAYQAALQREPLHPLALHDLARLRWRLGHPDFDAETRRAVALAPQQATASGVLGQLFRQAGRFEEAVPCFREALRRDPSNPGFLDGLGSCLVRLGAVDTGLTSHREALAMAPTDPEILSNQCTSLLVAGRPDEALAIACQACELAPAHQRALALRGLARRLLGLPETGASDLSAEVRRILLPAPPGWSDIRAFNQDLATELRILHGADRRQPIDQSLRGGTQTFGNLFASSLPAVTALKQSIADAVTRTIATMPDAGDAAEPHPYFRRRPAAPDSWRFDTAWSSRLSQGGFHTDHVHPHGWMSSVYYVHLPPGVDDQVRRQGWLRFGVPDFPIPGVPADSLVQHLVQPVEGLLVLFPSMRWHGTTPFDAVGERLTVAFDVLPY